VSKTAPAATPGPFSLVLFPLGLQLPGGLVRRSAAL